MQPRQIRLRQRRTKDRLDVGFQVIHVACAKQDGIGPLLVTGKSIGGIDLAFSLIPEETQWIVGIDAFRRQFPTFDKATHRLN